MADDVISTELKLLGSREYNEGLKSISSQLALLKSNLAASQSAFSDLDSMDALKDKLEGLSKVYEQHRQKVAFIQKQLDAAKQKYGENDTKVQGLQKALNNATVAMNKCGQEVQSTQERIGELSEGQEELTKETKKATKAEKENKEALEKQSSAAELAHKMLSKMGSAMGTIAKVGLKASAAAGAAAVTALAAAAKECASALISCATGAATYADDILTLSIQTGVSTDTLQKWQYAAAFVDVDLNTMASSMSKLTKKMSDMDKNGVKATDSITKLGLTIYDSNGDLKDSEDMFYEIVDALGQVSNETERDAMAMDIFGESAQTLNPLIEAGSNKLEELGEEAEACGYVLNTEALAAAGSYQDSLDTMTNVWTGFKNNLGVALTGLFQPFVDDASGAVGQVSLLLSDGWQDADASKLTEILTGAFNAFIEDAAKLWDGIKPALDALCKSATTWMNEELPKLVEKALPLAERALSGLTDTMKNVLNNVDWEAVGALFGELLVALTDAFTAIVKGLPDVIKGIDWSTVFDSLLDACKAVLDSVLSLFGTDFESIKTTIVGVFDSVGAYFTGLWEGIKKTFYDVVNELIKAYNSTLGWAFGDIELIGVDTEAAKGEGAAAVEAAVAGMEESQEAAVADASNVGENIGKGMADGMELSEEEVNAEIEKMKEEAAKKFREQWGINSPSKVTTEYGEYIGGGLALGMENSTRTVKDSGSKLCADLRSAIQSAVGANGAKFYSIGKQVGAGLASGILGSVGVIQSAAVEAANAAYTAAKDALGIHSPSTAFAYLGEMSAKGYTSGLDGALSGLSAAAATVSSAASAKSEGINYEKLGSAVASALKKEGVGEASVYMDGELVGQLTESAVSRETYRRSVSSVKGRSAALTI